MEKDKNIKYWNLETFDCIKVLEFDHPRDLFELEFYSDGYLLSCFRNKTKKLCHKQTILSLISTFTAHTYSLCCI